MQAKDLMIGDWVYYGYDCIIPTQYTIEYAHYIEELNSCFSPIPLTAEILELNGFGSIDIKNVSTIIKLNGDKLSWTGSITRGKLYVHEFQHILRICGYMRIADNFKVE